MNYECHFECTVIWIIWKNYIHLGCLRNQKPQWTYLRQICTLSSENRFSLKTWAKKNCHLAHFNLFPIITQNEQCETAIEFFMESLNNRYETAIYMFEIWMLHKRKKNGVANSQYGTAREYCDDNNESHIRYSISNAAKLNTVRCWIWKADTSSVRGQFFICAKMIVHICIESKLQCR